MPSIILIPPVLFLFRTLRVFDGPFAPGPDNWNRGLTQLGKGILNFWRHLIADFPTDDVIALQFAEVLGQHFAAGVRNESAQFAGTKGCLDEVVDDNWFPSTAHHFQGCFTGLTAKALTHQDHEVVFSGLYAMAFQPGSDRKNFTTVVDQDYLKQQQEEAYATEHQGFAPELETEIRKLETCDMLIFSSLSGGSACRQSGKAGWIGFSLTNTSTPVRVGSRT
jgi:hypothetical protein